MAPIIHHHYEYVAHRNLFGWECPKCRRFGREIWLSAEGAARAFKRHRHG